ncbi:murein hydrolase activator EnvC family protein [Pedobacter endophyticus]|uniref:Peptidoglycan DD-metalloendopeptidase family protein n=1 Tax=Pedobacter endophyticus TaxID=2789740 RepID=A0A7U3SP99_9SPHI|nr:peptidoglycan DD-metalloendopeptidase family protein [Pedobacter endophyticus]QPH38388.1 peptidoglycan DD-metalloendopeptidase family protein [Pedobacter endophyticus]
MKLHKFLFILFLSAFAISATAQTESQLRRKKEAIQREIEQLQKNLSKTASGKKLTLQQINGINAQIRLRQQKIGTINSEIKNIDNQISQNTNTVHNLQDQLGDLKKEYAAMIRFAQRNRNAYDKMMFIFASKDFNQAYKRIKYLQQFSQYRKKQAGYIETTQQNLNGKIKVLDKTLREKSNLLKEQEREQEKLGKDKNRQSVTLGKLSKQERQFKRDIAQRRKQQKQIDAAISAAIRRAIEEAKRKAAEAARIAAAKAAAEAAKAKAENRPAPAAPAAAKAKTTSEALTATPETARLSAGFENNRGRLPWPVANGTITETFGRHMVDQAPYTNDGVDITTSDGAAVRAVFSGKVLTVQYIQGRGVVIIIHGEYITVYQNLRNVSVSTGSNVETKQTIGVVANTGDDAILKFQIRRGQSPLNPEGWISK